MDCSFTKSALTLTGFLNVDWGLDLNDRKLVKGVYLEEEYS